MLAASYLVFADFRGTKISVTNREKFIDQINIEWLSNGDQILPTQSLLLSKYMDSKYMNTVGK